MTENQSSRPIDRPRSRTIVALVKQLVPPLLLLPLFGMPWDIGTSLFWLVGGVAACVSVAKLSRIRSARAPEQPPVWHVGLRPGLTVALFGAALVTMIVVSAGLETEVDQLGRALASEMQATCTRQATCLPIPPGSDWITIENHRAVKRVKSMSVEYRTDPAGSEFTVRIRHRMEDELRIHGGVGRTLKEEIVLR